MTNTAEDMSLAGAELLRNEILSHSGRKVSDVDFKIVAQLGRDKHKLPGFDMQIGSYNYHVYVEFDDPR